MGMLIGGFLSQSSPGFNPTVDGREAAVNHVLEVYGEDYVFGGNSTADASGRIYIWATASDIVIKVGGNASGNVSTDVLWWDNDSPSNSATAADYSPASGGTTIFSLGERTGVTVNIYTSNETTGFGSPTFPEMGTWTDDDKSTFFNPTNSTAYGGGVDCDASASMGAGPDSHQGFRTLQFTFRKTGYSDYTISFQAYVEALAEGEAP